MNSSISNSYNLVNTSAQADKQKLDATSDSGWRDFLFPEQPPQLEEVGGSGWLELNFPEQPPHLEEVAGWRDINTIEPILIPDQQGIVDKVGDSTFLELAQSGAMLHRKLIDQSTQTPATDSNLDSGVTNLNYDDALATAKSNRGAIGWEQVTIEEGEGNPLVVWRFSEDKFASEFKKLPPGMGIIDTVPRRVGDIPEAGPADGEDAGPGDADGDDGNGGVGAGGAL